MQRLDHITVKALECKAPGASMNDLAFLYGKIQKGAMFHDFNEQERNTILDALKSFDGLVPSFHTFFEDFKCLQIWGQCAKILKRVNPGKEGPGRTVFTALEQAFDETDQHMDRCIVQKGETVFTTIPGSIIDRVDLGYRQLFLYVMRHHRETIPGSTKMELKGRKKMMEGIHIPKPVDKLAWCRFATLADRLGFASAEIASLTLMDEAVVKVPSERAKPSFITTEAGQCDERRSGRPFDLAYKQSQDGLFLENVHSEDKRQGRGITPFFVRRSIYLAFLGQLPFTGQTTPHAPPTRAAEWRPQETRHPPSNEETGGRGEAEASQGEAAPEDTAPALSSQEGPMPQESWEEALHGVGDVVLPQDFEPDKEAILEQSIERLETHDGGDGWDSEAPSIMGSSFYSDEDQGFQVGSSITS